MKKALLSSFFITLFLAGSAFSQQGGMERQGGMVDMNADQMIESQADPSLSRTGPGMAGETGYFTLIDPRAMNAMIGYVMKPHTIRTFQNDLAAYQYFLDQTEGLRKKLINKMFDYYEAMRKPNTKPATIKKIEKEIVDLRWQIFDKGTKQN